MVIQLSAAILSRLFLGDPNQRALQWWHRRQIGRLHDGAELIRDGILQDLFAIRRMLELTCDRQAPISPAHLQQLDDLHARLERVSNELSPAFIQDSLPLAIQHRLTGWQQRHNVPVTAQLPSGPFQSAGLSHHLVLTALEELLTLIASELDPDPAEAAMAVSLSHQAETATLEVTLQQLSSTQRHHIAQIEALRHLQASFKYLTKGSLCQTAEASQIHWRFRWPIKAH